MPVQQSTEHRGVDLGRVGGTVPGDGGLLDRVRSYGSQWFFQRAVRHGLPPVPTRVMISQSARSSKMREVGMRTVVRFRPVMA